MDKNEIKQKICAAEKQAATAKKQRRAKVVAGFAVAYFLGFWFMEGKIDDVKVLLKLVILSIVLSFIHFAVNESVFDHLHNEEEKDRQMINIMKKQIRDDAAEKQ